MALKMGESFVTFRLVLLCCWLVSVASGFATVSRATTAFHHHQVEAFDFPKKHARLTRPRSLLSTTSRPKSSLSVSSRPISQVITSNLADSVASSLPSASLANLKQVLADASKTLNEIKRSSLIGAKQAFKASWWSLPLLLCLVPFFSLLVFNTPAATPECWKLVNIDFIKKSANATLVIACFLLSNIFYYLSGLFLLFKFPPRLVADSLSSSSSAGAAGAGGRLSMITKQQPSQLLLILQQLLPTTTTNRFTWLGVWVLMAGTVSTIFHSVQALGPYSLAEGWCYVDHGVAGAGVLYFWHTLGRPSTRAAILALLALLALALPPPTPRFYAWLHSSWHFLSAACSVVWALEKHNNNKKQQQRLVPVPVVVVSSDEPTTSERQ